MISRNNCSIALWLTGFGIESLAAVVVAEDDVVVLSSVV
jgi:hypothetical protein